MDGVRLLHRAWAAGLSVAAVGDRLVIRGPRHAEGLARHLLANKTSVLAALQRLAVKPTPADLPPDWHLLWDERAAIMEYDGRLPREQAEAAALRDILRQMQQTQPPAGRGRQRRDHAP